MKLKALFAAALLASALLAPATVFAQEETLRIDYIFSGTDKTAEISVDELCRLEGWAGRRTRLKEVPLRGNGQICMTSAASGDTLYRTSFSTLFQEWQATEEAVSVRKSFENVFLLPMPSEPVNISVELYDFKGNTAASLTHPVDPGDILIRPAGGFNPSDVADLVEGNEKGKYVHFSGSPAEKIDVAIVAEGYTAEEMDLFYADAQAAVESIFNHDPFGALRDRFNFLAVRSVSEDSGVSVPREGVWKKTAVGSNFDTFYSDRYLTTLRLRQLHDVLADVPYEHIIILANTDTYGGGGIYNSYTLTTAHHPLFKPVVVHEFGHSFGALADEYYYDDQFVEYYYPGVEPWEKNITTLADFGSKWLGLLPAGAVVTAEGRITDSEGSVLNPEDFGISTGSASSKRAARRTLRAAGASREDSSSPSSLGGRQAGTVGQETAEGTSGLDSGRGAGQGDAAWLFEGGGYQSKGVWRGAEDCRMKTNEAAGFCPVCQHAIEDIIRFYTED
ncbi:MAG: M64 family metallopeptidase [Bacteroidia bacterium]|nr:M64 family metallopeptidase [Bacteroidia bacterium]